MNILKSYKAQYGAQIFEYSVLRKVDKARARKLDIHVYPNGKVQVDAPESASIAEIKAGVLKRARWVLTQLDGIAERNKEVLTREYVSGEALFYLGRRYQLKVDKRIKGGAVKFYRGKIIVPAYNKSQDEIKKMLEDWYREKALLNFEKRLTLIVKPLPWVDTLPKWKLLKMKRQWGSCSPKGVLSLNPELVKAPTECIDYVLLHELCHLKEHNHSKQFYRLLDTYMYDWKAVKYKLDNMAELLLNV